VRITVGTFITALTDVSYAGRADYVVAAIVDGSVALATMNGLIDWTPAHLVGSEFRVATDVERAAFIGTRGIDTAPPQHWSDTALRVGAFNSPVDTGPTSQDWHGGVWDR
jgi:hypothetical protein